VFLTIRALRRADAPEADLHQRIHAPRLDGARKRTGVRERIALILLIKIGMRIHMQDVHGAMDVFQRVQNRKGHRMIAAETQRFCLGFHRCGYTRGNRCARRVAVRRQVSEIIGADRLARIDACDGEGAGAFRKQDGANDRRRESRPARIRRTRIPWKAEKGDGHGAALKLLASLDDKFEIDPTVIH